MSNINQCQSCGTFDFAGYNSCQKCGGSFTVEIANVQKVRKLKETCVHENTVTRHQIVCDPMTVTVCIDCGVKVQ